MTHVSRDDISAYLDEELPRQEMERVASHLGDCRECSEILGRWQRLKQAIAIASEVEYSEEFVDSVLDRIAVSDQKSHEQAVGYWGREVVSNCVIRFQTVVQNLSEFCCQFGGPGYAYTSAVMLLIGFLIGYLMPGTLNSVQESYRSIQELFYYNGQML
jgi:anti-sigma factor RsiW